MDDMAVVNGENFDDANMTKGNEGALEVWEDLETKDLNSLELCQLQIIDLKNQLETSRQEWRGLYNLVMNSMKDNSFANLLSSEEDYSRWFMLLPRATMKYMVIMTVRDTPGANMPDHVYKAIIDAGFTKFKRDMVYTYVGVRYKDKTWYDEGRHHDEPTHYIYESMDESLSMKALSESWKNGNRGDIVINGKQLSVNSRGVNIVVYDAGAKKVIDSIGFDSHVEGQISFRRK